MSSGAPKEAVYKMPAPPAIVLWLNARGAEKLYAVVTKVGRSAISVGVFAPESRGAVPKEAVRYIDDPEVKEHGAHPDYGVWDFTDEHKLLLDLKRRCDESPDVQF